jgi:hypothetical protein
MSDVATASCLVCVLRSIDVPTYLVHMEATGLGVRIPLVAACDQSQICTEAVGYRSNDGIGS